MEAPPLYFARVVIVTSVRTQSTGKTNDPFQFATRSTHDMVDVGSQRCHRSERSERPERAQQHAMSSLARDLGQGGE
jgi:hypothetical protein